MKIAIEAQRIFRRNKHGMDFVALETIRVLQQIDTENQYIILIGNGDDKCLSESENVKIIQVETSGDYPIWEQIILPRLLRKIKPDILHCTSNTAPIHCNVPLILTLHDIIFLEKQPANNTSLYQQLGRIYRRLIVPRVLPNCKRIITVSQFERDRIKQFLHIPTDKIMAIHNGYNAHFTPIEHPQNTTSKYIEQSSYIFFLGNTDPKKNTRRTLSAYAQYLNASTRKRQLLIADLSLSDLKEILKSEQIEWILEHITLTDYIVNTDLPAIYSGAFAFLYTSLRESFGIPILEAMACGTPVITSNTSAIPEIAGDGAILVNPTQISEITEALIHLENDTLFYNQAVNYGLQRATAFSWENTARNLLKLYAEVHHENYTLH